MAVSKVLSLLIVALLFGLAVSQPSGAPAPSPASANPTKHNSPTPPPSSGSPTKHNSPTPPPSSESPTPMPAVLSPPSSPSSSPSTAVPPSADAAPAPSPNAAAFLNKAGLSLAVFLAVALMA